MVLSEGSLYAGTFLVALFGSGHCFGMCGGLAAFAGVRRAPAYHAGRGVGYAAVGAVAGGLGEAAFRVFADRPEGLLAVIAGFAAVQVAQFARVWSGERSGLTERVFGRRLSGWRTRLARSAGPFGTGLATALVPCGWFVYFGWIAAATGSAAKGAAVFATLWAGSLPALLAAAAAAGWLGKRFSGDRYRRAGAALLLAVSLGSLAPRWGAFEAGMRAPVSVPHCGTTETPEDGPRTRPPVEIGSAPIR